MPQASSNSGIRDNHSRGSVGDFLRQQLKPGADLDLVTAYFTVFAYDKLRTELNQLGRIRLLFGEAAFIKTIDPDKKDGAAYVLNDDGLALANGLSQRHLAQACAQWMRDKVDVRSVTRTVSGVTGAIIKSRLPEAKRAYALYEEGHANEPDKLINDDTSVTLTKDKGPKRFYTVPPASFG